jgi:hypothetical protein
MTDSVSGPFQSCFSTIPVCLWGSITATACSGIAWPVSDHVMLYSGSRNLLGVLTHFHEVITLVSDDHQVRTTQLYEQCEYRHVTMIDEWRQQRQPIA